ncbi:DUF1569 domain-containing protein [Cognatiyoonia sediminum]|uniref:DUF1569 domain-containing protein n=1 Tax=Cognatiyoonia sediminum TaxID=1508389 RepID=UPI00093407F8|nr:DUF1569 domain-containing protein [Cognatiyoonia sediminum]
MIENEPTEGLLRFKSVPSIFRAYEAHLKPHFAYGVLEKSDYAIAYVLYISNHLEEFRLT